MLFQGIYAIQNTVRMRTLTVRIGTGFGRNAVFRQQQRLRFWEARAFVI